MFNHTKIIKTAAVTLATATAALAAAVPALGAPSPLPAASAQLGLASVLSWTGLPGYDEDALAGRGLDIPPGLAETLESVGGNADAIRDLEALLDRENGFGPDTALDSSLGGSEDRRDPRAGFSTESRTASLLERDEPTNPVDGFGDPNEGDGRHNTMFGSGGSGSRGTSGGGVRFAGPGRTSDGTRIGAGGGQTSQDSDSDHWGFMRPVDGGYVSVQADRDDEGHTVTTTVRPGDGAGYTLFEVYDEDGRLVRTSFSGSEGTLIIHYDESGEPTTGGYFPHWPEEEEEESPDEQPNPEGGSDGTKQGCQWNPMYDRCWGDAWEVSGEDKVSQPGGGPETGEQPSHEGGFRASIQERLNVVTQPSPEGGNLSGGGGGSETGAPGGGGPCTVC